MEYIFHIFCCEYWFNYYHVGGSSDNMAMVNSISQNEQDVIQLLLEHGPCSIAQLESHLHVTATAVRQRLTRLMAAGLIDRQSESEGRGRPNHRYEVTDLGRKSTGNNLADFADALWREVQSLEDQDLKRSIIAGASKRLAASYSDRIQGQHLEDKLLSVAELFGERNIPTTVENNNGLPILKVLACPYPDLANDSHDVCEMERQLFSEVTGGALELCQCRQDGDRCCTFKPTNQNTNN